MANCDQAARQTAESTDTYFTTVNTYLHDTLNNIHRNTIMDNINNIRDRGTNSVFQSTVDKNVPL